MLFRSVKRFIAANNDNDVFLQYLKTGKYNPRPSSSTIANAMDVGDPSNFVRVLELYKHNYQAIVADISGCKYSNAQIRETIRKVYKETGYVLDPHGACGYAGLKDSLQNDETGIFLETAHPAKFLDTVKDCLNTTIEIPEKLQAFMSNEKQSVPMSKYFEEFKTILK